MTIPRVLLAALAVAAVGCDDAFIDPYVNPGRYFTVWGYVDPAAGRQTVRVVPVTRLPSVGTREPAVGDLDARVFSTEVATGIETEWSPSVVQLEDGTFAHVFWTNARFRPGFHYVLEVRRSDGKKASADTWIPRDNWTVAVRRGEVREDPDGNLRQEVSLEGIDSPWAIRVTYLVQNALDRLVTEIPYGRAGMRGMGSGWLIDVDLTADQVAVRADVRAAILAGEVRGEDGLNTPFNLHQMGIRLVMPDGNWDLPEGEIDPERFARPDAHTNVVGGYGYWGAVAFYENKWAVSNQLSVRLGWEY